MKKMLSLALALAMCLSLAACGSSGSGSSTQDQSGGSSSSGSSSQGDASTPDTAESDLAYVQDKGTLVVGITEFDPMDYRDADGNWIGFDADMAKLVAEKLGVEPVFTVINWDNKVFELNGKGIDVVWNGMTITTAAQESMECTNAYCNNAQVIVTK